MPRKREVQKRGILPDPIYGNKLVNKFVNVVMKDGKKSLAERILYGSFDLIKQKAKQDPLVVFEKAIDNVKPAVEVKSRRVGGSTYQVPIDVRQQRRSALAIRWLIQFARKRPEHTMQERLAAEFLDAFNNRGASVKKKEDTHKMAEANKAFAHYRW